MEYIVLLIIIACILIGAGIALLKDDTRQKTGGNWDDVQDQDVVKENDEAWFRAGGTRN